MLKKSLAGVGLTVAAIAGSITPAMAIGDSDGLANSLQGAGGTNMTGTWGDDSPNFHFLDNPNICVPEIHNIGVGVLGVAVPVEVPALSGQSKQYCSVGETVQGSGDHGISHVIG